MDLYALLKPLLVLMHKVFFRSRVITNKHRVPNNKPVILASNHPNSFNDPVYIGLQLRQHIYFLARGDVFKGDFVKWLLAQIHILPIFRKEDGENNNEKNQQTFEMCAGLFRQNKNIVIFPEGYCVQERKLRPLKKGTARMAFHALETSGPDLDLHIVPVGINYSNPNRFRSEMVMNFGEPIVIKDYWEDYQNDKNKIVTQVTRLLEERMKSLLIVIDHRPYERLSDYIEIIYKEDFKQHYGVDFTSPEQRYELRRVLARIINKAHSSADGMIEDLHSTTDHYFKHLEKLRLRDHVISKTFGPKDFMFSLFLLIIGFPLYGIGVLLNYVPYMYPYRIAKKAARQIEFFPAVLFNAAALLFFFYYLIQTIVICMFFPGYLVPFILLLMPLSGWFAYKYNTYLKKFAGQWRYRTIKANDTQKAVQLNDARELLLEQVKDFVIKYQFEWTFRPSGDKLTV